MTLSSIRKVYQGIADRRQMFAMFDRHAQRLIPWQNDDSALHCGEWFEVGQAEYDYMLEILPPLWMRADMFAMREFLTGSVTSVFFAPAIDGRQRFFHGAQPVRPFRMTLRGLMIEPGRMGDEEGGHANLLSGMMPSRDGLSMIAKSSRRPCDSRMRWL